MGKGKKAVVGLLVRSKGEGWEGLCLLEQDLSQKGAKGGLAAVVELAELGLVPKMRREPGKQLLGRAHVPEVHEADHIDVRGVGVVDQRRHLLLGELRADTGGQGAPLLRRLEQSTCTLCIGRGACETYNQACSV